MKRTYNSLKRNYQQDGQLFLVHFHGEWHSGLTRYIQNQKVSGSNATDALGHTVEPTLLRGSRWTSGRTLNTVVLNIEWSCLLVSDLKVALVQPNG